VRATSSRRWPTANCRRTDGVVVKRRFRVMRPTCQQTTAAAAVAAAASSLSTLSAGCKPMSLCFQPSSANSVYLLRVVDANLRCILEM